MEQHLKTTQLMIIFQVFIKTDDFSFILCKLKLLINSCIKEVSFVNQLKLRLCQSQSFYS